MVHLHVPAKWGSPLPYSIKQVKGSSVEENPSDEGLAYLVSNRHLTDLRSPYLREAEMPYHNHGVISGVNVHRDELLSRLEDLGKGDSALR